MMRLSRGGVVDRAQPIPFTWEGRPLLGLAGDTLASALLANGVRVVGRSFKTHRPRGLYGAWVEEPNAIVDLADGDAHDPTARATLVELRSGMAARGINAFPDVARDIYGALDLVHRFLPAGFYYKTFMRPGWHSYEPQIRRMAGLGRIRPDDDDRQFETRHAHCDVLVVGAGPAGLAAARVAAASGARVILADDRLHWGGALGWRDGTVDARPGGQWVAAEITALAVADNVRLLPRTTVFGAYGHGAFGLIERRAAAIEGWAPERLWQVRARQTVLATGAIERPLVFPDNDRPGVMSADAVLHHLRRHAVLPGRVAVVTTNNDSAYEAAIALRAAGATVLLADLRPHEVHAAAAARTAGVRVLTGMAVLATGSHAGVRWVELGVPDATSRRQAAMRVAADLVAVSGGWSPTVHLYSQAGGRLVWDPVAVAFVPGRPVQGFWLAGAVTGQFDLASCLAQGHAAGMQAVNAVGRRADLAPPHAEPHESATAAAHWHMRVRGARQWVDFQNDVTVKDVALAAREGFRSVEHLKRYTTLGMATDQGKLSNVNGLAVLAEATGRTIPEVGTTTFRPPFAPVPLGALAGLRHGALHAPHRTLPAHAAHTALGASWREYGAGWMRPACYPHPGETIEAAIRREAEAVRRGAGVFDGSSLGKIEVFGPDAAAFLNLMFYNEVATLKPGRIRYCLLLRETGIIYDDGVVARLAPDRYLLSPSSSHAAGVLTMLEQWRQTEYPAMRVAFHDVTAAWATIAVGGPAARGLVAALAPIDLATLPHMALAETTVGGVPARIARVSFTGETSYELSVPAGRGRALWEHLAAQPGVTPYGIESLSVLRAEKGYILIGIDTDGTTMPDDIGLSGPARSKTVDFVGRRSLTVPEAVRPDRRQFVGLLPEDPTHIPAPGAHAVTGGRSQGWVTTSCFSPALGRSMALAMIEAGRSRHGETIGLYHLGATSRATITVPVFVDPAGERLRD